MWKYLNARNFKIERILTYLKIKNGLEYFESFS